MVQALFDENATSGAVGVNQLDAVVLGVAEVQVLQLDVQGDAIRPANFLRNDNGSVGSVHPSSFNLSRFTPIRPIHPTVQRIDDDVTRFVKIARNEDAP